MNIEESLKLLGIQGITELPKETPLDVAEWAREISVHILNSRMEGESDSTLFMRLHEPLYEQGKEKFPDCRYLFVFFYREFFELARTALKSHL